MSKSNVKKDAVGFGYIAAGCVFLFNPIVSIFDFLPDFIGFLLIYRGLFTPSFCTEKLRDARNCLWKLAIITAARIASLLFLPGKSESFTLLLVFAFGVLEALWTIPCILSTFDGFYDLGRRFDVQSVFAPRADKKAKRTNGAVKYTETAEKLKTYSILFFIVKTVATILPELTALDVNYDLSERAQYGVSVTILKPYFYILGVIVTLVFGIIWLIRVLRYVIGMMRDKNLTAGIRQYYKEAVESDAGFVAAIRMKNVLLMFMLSAVALFPLQFDGVSVLPSVIFAAIAVLALRVLYSYDKRALYGLIPAVLSAVLSVVGTVLQIPYFAEYDAEAARYLANAIRLYKPIRLLGTAEFVCVFALFVYFLFILCRVVKQHAALVGGPSHGNQYSAEARAAEIMKSVYARVIGVGIVGGAYILLRAASFTAAMYFEAMWGIQVIAAVIFVAVVIYCVSAMSDYIYERLENRY